MLKPEVIQAVEQGKFHVFAASTIDEGVELLIGKPAGKPDADGNYPEDSVNGRVMKRLMELAELYRAHADKTEAKDKPSGKPKPLPEKKVHRKPVR